MNEMELAAGGLFFLGAFGATFLFMCALILGKRSDGDDE
jgi:hypothetical protein